MLVQGGAGANYQERVVYILGLFQFFLSVVSSVEISYKKTNLWCIQLYFWTKNLLGYLQLPDISSFKIIVYEVYNSCNSSYCQCCH